MKYKRLLLTLIILILLVLFSTISFSLQNNDPTKEQNVLFETGNNNNSNNTQSNGYIVELETKPLILQMTTKDKTEILTSNDPKIMQTISSNNIDSTKQEKNRIKEEILKIIDDSNNNNTNNVQNNIQMSSSNIGSSSNVNSNSEENNKITHEYNYIFNGFAINASEEQSKLIAQIDGVKKVWPNNKVHINLEESVPLIQEGILAGQLDEDGNDCTITEKPCLTGEGVKIAIIDTGVDYSHLDLGCTDLEICNNIIRPYTPNFPRIFNDTIVWHDDRTGSFEIYMYNISNEMEIKITNTSDNVLPDVYGNKIAWVDHDGYIKYYDLSNGSLETLSNTYSSKPRIYENLITWSEDNGESSYSLWIYNTTDKQKIMIQENHTWEPIIYENYVCWRDDRNVEEGSAFGDVYCKNIITEEEIRITPDSHAGSNGYEIYGEYVVWLDFVNQEMYLYNLSDLTNTLIGNSTILWTPSIYQNKIVWPELVSNEIKDIMHYIETEEKTNLGTNLTYIGLYENNLIGIGDLGQLYLHDIISNETRQITNNNNVTNISDFFPNSKVIGGYDFVENDNDPIDEHGHGTHCAGIAAGNGTIKGVAPGAQILAYRVLDASGSGYMSDVIAGIEQAVIDGADVLSLSLGGGGDPDDPSSQAIDNAVLAGKIAVVAAGNSGPNEQSIGSPGTAKKAITVGATNKADGLASFSSIGPVIWTNEDGYQETINKPDILAPGVSICSSYASGVSRWDAYKCLDDQHTAISGTSMATPHMAGVSALIKQEHPDWTPDEIKAVIKGTAIDLGYSPIEQGLGRVNVSALVKTRNKYPIVFIRTTLNDTEINIYGTAISDNFENYSLYVNEDWLTGANSSINDNLIYTINTSQYLDGDYTLKLEAISSDNTISNTYIPFDVSNLEIKSPMGFDIFKTGSIIDITLEEIRYPDMDYNLSYSKQIDNNWTLANITKEINLENNSIGKWNTSGLDPGFYKVQMNFSIPGLGIIEKDIDKIYFDSSLREGWPVRIEDELVCDEDLEDNVNYLATKDGKIIIRAITSNITTYTDYDLTKKTFHIKNNQILENDTPYTILSKKNNISSSNCEYYGVGFIEPVVEDIDGDNNKEIITYTGGNPPKLSVYDINGTLKWKKGVGTNEVYGGNLHIPLIGDINNDGKKEIIAFNWGKYYEEKGSKIIAINNEGTAIWETNITSSLRVTLLMADLNNDGNKEIVVKSNDAWDRKITILSSEGNIISEIPLNDKRWSGSIESSPAIGNFDDDTDYEIISADPSEDAGVTELGWNNVGHISIFNEDGTTVDGWPIYTQGVIFSSPVSGDINNDGNDDVIIGFMYAANEIDENYGGLHVYNRNGTEHEGWPILRGYEIWSSAAIGDINNDNQNEIVTSILGLKTYVVDKSGEILEGWPKDTAWNSYYSNNLADINGDGNIDILTTAAGIETCDSFGNDCGGVYAWDKNGESIQGFPKVTEVDAQGPLTVFDNNGYISIAASSNLDSDILTWKKRGSIYIWDINKTYNATNSPWTKFKHDSQLTGCSNCNKILNFTSQLAYPFQINSDTEYNFSINLKNPSDTTKNITYNLSYALCEYSNKLNCNYTTLKYGTTNLREKTNFTTNTSIIFSEGGEYTFKLNITGDENEIKYYRLNAEDVFAYMYGYINIDGDNYVNTPTNFTINVQNQGNEKTENAYYELYHQKGYCDYDYGNCENLQLITRENISIDAQEQIETILNYTYTEPGYYTVVLLLNSTNNNNSEDSKYQNYFNVRLPGVDIKPEISLDNYDTKVIGENISLELYIINDGNENATNVTVNVYLIDESDNIIENISNFTINKIESNEYEENYKYFNISYTLKETGIYTIYVNTSCNEDVDMTNNEVNTPTFRILQPGPEIYPQISLDNYDTKVIGENISLELYIINDGNENATNVTVNFYLIDESDNIIENISNFTINKIESNEYEENYKYFIINHTLTKKGIYKIYATTDCNEDVELTNNVAESGWLTIKSIGRDLTISNIQLINNTYPYYLRVYLENSGNISLENTTFNVSATIDNNYTEITETSLEYDYQQVYFSIPRDMKSGIHNISVIANLTEDVDNTDNTYSAEIQLPKINTFSLKIMDSKGNYAKRQVIDNLEEEIYFSENGPVNLTIIEGIEAIAILDSNINISELNSENLTYYQAAIFKYFQNENNETIITENPKIINDNEENYYFINSFKPSFNYTELTLFSIINASELIKIGIEDRFDEKLEAVYCEEYDFTHNKCNEEWKYPSNVFKAQDENYLIIQSQYILENTHITATALRFAKTLIGTNESEIVGDIAEEYEKENAYGKIDFQENVNVSRIKENSALLQNINISAHRIYINTTALPEFENILSNITFRSVNYTNPKILRNGIACGDYCSNTKYNKTNSILTTTVNGFSEYTVIESSNNNGNSGGSGGSSMSMAPSTPTLNFKNGFENIFAGNTAKFNLNISNKLFTLNIIEVKTNSTAYTLSNIDSNNAIREISLNNTEKIDITDTTRLIIKLNEIKQNKANLTLSIESKSNSPTLNKSINNNGENISSEVTNDTQKISNNRPPVYKKILDNENNILGKISIGLIATMIIIGLIILTISIITKRKKDIPNLAENKEVVIPFETRNIPELDIQNNYEDNKKIDTKNNNTYYDHLNEKKKNNKISAKNQKHRKIKKANSKNTKHKKRK